MEGGFIKKGNAFSALQAELMAIREGLLTAVTYGWDNVEIVFDCLNAVNLINNHTSCTNDCINLVNDCRVLHEQNSWCQIRYEGRKRNIVANGLAKHARKEMTTRNCTSLLDSPPTCIYALYFADLTNLSVINVETVDNNFSFHENVP